MQALAYCCGTMSNPISAVLPGTNGKPSHHVEISCPQVGYQNINRFQVIDTDAKPSWQRVGQGTAMIELQAHTEAGWLQFTMRETPESGRGGKETHFTLYREGAKQLLEFLKKSLGE